MNKEEIKNLIIGGIEKYTRYRESLGGGLEWRTGISETIMPAPGNREYYTITIWVSIGSENKTNILRDTFSPSLKPTDAPINEDEVWLHSYERLLTSMICGGFASAFTNLENLRLR